MSCCKIGRPAWRQRTGPLSCAAPACTDGGGRVTSGEVGAATSLLNCRITVLRLIPSSRAIRLERHPSSLSRNIAKTSSGSVASLRGSLNASSSAQSSIEAGVTRQKPRTARRTPRAPKIPAVRTAVRLQVSENIEKMAEPDSSDTPRAPLRAPRGVRLSAAPDVRLVCAIRTPQINLTSSTHTRFGENIRLSSYLANPLSRNQN